jgi:hypothetical protein
MLVIRKSQMRALAEPQRALFDAMALRGLGQLFPADARLADEVGMRTFFNNAIARASRYRILHERALLLFIFLEFDQGSCFEALPGQAWMVRILDDIGLEDGEKMDVIFARLQIAAGATTP